MRGLLIATLLVVSAAPLVAGAQELVLDRHDRYLARVVSVISEERRVLPGLDTETDFQTIRAVLLEGPQEGLTITLENDYLHLTEGERFYVVHTTNPVEDLSVYAVSDPYRIPTLITVTVLFVAVVVAFGGWQGIRGMMALVGSLFLIFYLLLPGILSGYSPLLVGISVSSLIIVVGSYITHGFNRTTSSAVLGMILAIIVTGTLAYAVVDFARLTGFETEEAMYLNVGMRGSIDLVGILLSGMMIGLLGVLYEAAIGQAIAVEELKRASASLSRRYVFTRALRMGREHIGALVNTLAIAYVGASLPLLLLFYSTSSGILMPLNSEIFATEIVRTMVGGIGLVLAVPLTTLIAVYLVRTNPSRGESLHSPHIHSHGHGHTHMN